MMYYVEVLILSLAIVWLSHSVLFVLHKLKPVCFIIAQLLFIILWYIMPNKQGNIGFFQIRDIPMLWLFASVIFLFNLFNEKKEK